MTITGTADPRTLYQKVKSFNYSWRNAGPAIILICLIISYIIAIMIMHYLNYTGFRYGFDLSFYEQSVWNTVHGRVLEVSATDFSSSLLGTDAILILAMMAPFYAIVPSPFTLLFIETLVVGLGALPVFWLASERLKNKWFGVLMAASYLFLLSVQNGNLYEWRERPMAMGFLLFAFYYYQRGHFKTFVLFAVLVLCCRPENGLVLAMLGLYGYLKGYHKKDNFGWKYVIPPFVLGLLWFGIVVMIIIPANSVGHSFALAENYGDLGQTPGDILKNLFIQPIKSAQIIFPSPSVTISKLVYIPLLLLPFAFLPLGSPSVLLMTLPPLALNILSIRSTQYNPYNYHYQGSIVPWLLFASIYTIEKICSRDNYPAGSYQNSGKSSLIVNFSRNALAFGIIILSLTLIIYFVSDINPIKRSVRPVARSDAEDGKALLKEIPVDAPLAISNLWADQVPEREHLWLLQIEKLYSLHPTLQAQYVFIDKHTIASKDAPPDNVALINGLLQNPAWETVDAKGFYVLLRRK